MMRVTRRAGHPRLAGRLSAGVAVVVLVMTASLATAGLVLGANPNAPPAAAPSPTSNPGQLKKATPTPTPLVTPAPTPVPAPVSTPVSAPAAAPTAAPAAAPTGTPAPTLTSGATASPSAGANGTSAPGSTSPVAGGGVTSPGLSSGTGPGGEPPVAAFLLIMVVGILAITGGWFIVGRRSSSKDEAAVPIPDDGTSGPHQAAPTMPSGPMPTMAYSGAPFKDPLVAAIARSRDAHGSAGQVGTTASVESGSDPSTFKSPSWVRRLDPEIKVIPGLATQAERPDEAHKDEPKRRNRREAPAGRSA